tara:strand:+ start:270 stop:578 length:309 start_codon:yes stop_codon:yes gene_type:complete
MIRFIEVVNTTDHNPRMERTAKGSFTLGEVWINEEYVVSVRDAPGYKKLLAEGSLPSDLEQHHAFARIITNNGNVSEAHIVVGTPQAVAARLNKDIPQLLKG